MADIALLFQADDPRLRTTVGVRDGETIVLSNSAAGIGLYGPYVDLPSGRYRARIRFAEAHETAGSVTMDVCEEAATKIISAAEFDLSNLAPGKREIELAFSLDRAASLCEVRLFCAAAVSATITRIEILFLDFEASLVGWLDRLERLTHGGRATYVGNNRILARLVVGDTIFAFLMPANDLLIVPATIARGEYEPALTRYFTRTVAGTDHCLDVGANYGYYTCLMASLTPGGKVLGIEPDEAIFALMRDNLYINTLEPSAKALHAAVADRSGRLTLHRRSTRSGNTSIIKYTSDYTASAGEQAAMPFEVECFAIDDLLPRFDGRIDIAKIDVEGAEPLVFRGARRTIHENPQIRIVMEWSPGQIRAAGFDVGEFVTELTSLRLDAAIIGSAGPEPVALADLSHTSYHSGILLTPRS